MENNYANTYGRTFVCMNKPNIHTKILGAVTFSNLRETYYSFHIRPYVYQEIKLLLYTLNLRFLKLLCTVPDVT